MMSFMEPLLYAAGVDMVLARHVHAYARSNQVYGGKSDRCGAVHVTFGDGGYSEGLARRNEASGALTRLTRVKRFQQDDAHIFCREGQVKDES